MYVAIIHETLESTSAGHGEIEDNEIAYPCTGQAATELTTG